MIVKSLEVNLFKNIEYGNIDFDERINIFSGNNGQGKTNYIESIYFCLSLKNFKDLKNSNLLKYGESQAVIKVTAVETKIENKYKLILSELNRIAILNDKKPDSSQSWFDQSEILSFVPDEVANVRKSPGDRRQLIDRGIFQYDNFFLNDYRNFDKCLKQRNFLLKKNAKWSEIEPWTIQLIHHAKNISNKRNNHVELINKNINKVFEFVTDCKDKIEIVYDTRNIEKLDISNFRNNYDRDLKYGYTVDGPHRDDIEFYINDKQAKISASQGQIRLIVLAIKVCQIQIIKSFKNRFPVLLLDDIGGELDRNRLEKFFKILEQEEVQLFITTSNLRQLPEAVVKQARCYEIQEGRAVLQTQ